MGRIFKGDKHLSCQFLQKTVCCNAGNYDSMTEREKNSIKNNKSINIFDDTDQEPVISYLSFDSK